MIEGSHVALSKINTSSSYRLSCVLLRVSLAGNVVMLLAVLGCLGALLKILPMKTVHPVLVRIADTSAQIVDIEVLRPSQESCHVYLEAMSRSFVVARETINLVDDMERLSSLMDTFMSEELAVAFSSAMTLDNKNSPLNQARDKKIQKSVVIEASRPHPTSEDCIDVEWRATFTHQPSGKVLEVKRFRTLVRGEFTSRAMTKKQSLENPLALEIVAYSTEERE